MVTDSKQKYLLVVLNKEFLSLFMNYFNFKN